jgi:hypothetical protein
MLARLCRRRNLPLGTELPTKMTNKISRRSKKNILKKLKTKSKRKRIALEKRALVVGMRAMSTVSAGVMKTKLKTSRRQRRPVD